MERTPLQPRAPLLDIAYYDGVDAHLHKHKLDIFHPPNFSASADLRPVVLHVHGGGWVRGDRKHEFYGGPYMGRAFSERGYVSVVCSYRLAEHGKHPAQVRDVARALAWVVANIRTYGGNPDRIFLSGHSAGAHIVALLALHPKYLAEVNLTRAHIKGVVPISGIYHLLYPMHERAVEDEPNTSCLDWKTRIFHHMYVGPTFGTTTAELTDASPIVHLRAAVAASDPPPPFLVINAESDLGLEIGGSWFAKEMQRHKAEASYRVVAGTNHASVTRSDATVQLAHAFFQHRLQLLQQAPLRAEASVATHAHLLQSV